MKGLAWANYSLPGDFIYTMRRYRHTFGVWPNLLRPRTFNEHVNHKKLFQRDPLLTVLADKYAVRDYVSARVGPGYLTELYQHTTDPREIDLSKLPDRFAVKATHGCGWNLLVQDKDTVKQDDLVALCDSWLKTNYYIFGREWCYRDVPPRIIIEEFLTDERGEIPYDYKIFCFGGVPTYIQVDLDRFKDHRRNIYDTSWTLVPFTILYENADEDLDPPAELDEIIDVAGALAQGQDFVRVDLYCTGNRVVFGELTAYPGNGFVPVRPAQYELHLGDLWP